MMNRTRIRPRFAWKPVFLRASINMTGSRFMVEGSRMPSHAWSLEPRTLNQSARGFLIGALSLVLTSLVPGNLAMAQVTKLLRYQGQAVDSNSVPLEGPYTLTFRLYDAQTAGTKIWEEVQPNIPLKGGYFSVLLGQVTSLSTMDWTNPRWLAIQVNADPELSPRQQLTSVPTAIKAERAEQLEGPMCILGDKVGIGTTSPANFLHVSYSDSTAFNPGAGSGSTGLRVTNTTGGVAGRGVGLRLTNDGADSIGVLGVVTNAAGFGDVVLKTYNGGAAYKDALTVTSAGNVGINTIPTTILSVQQASATDPIADS